MLALSIVINRPLCYINAYTDERIKSKQDTEIVCTSEQEANFRYHVVHAFNFQLNLQPVNFILFERHFVPLIPTSSSDIIFDFKKITFINHYKNFILSDDRFN